VKSRDCIRELSELVETYLLVYRGVRIASLPGKPRRDQLEEIAWKILNEAIAFKETEDSARNSRARLRVMQVVCSLMRVHLSILHDQDDAFVDGLLGEVEQTVDDLKKKRARMEESARGR
jgi:hypothetical protein